MIKFDKVSKNYGEQTVIYNQDFIIKDGEFFVMVGPSGCGKSTTIKMINRLVEPSTGDIYMDGKKIKDYPLRELRLSIGYVLQNIALFHQCSLLENRQI